MKSPNPWSCMPTALAYLLGVSVERIIQAIGHDGSEILFPNLSDPLGRRGFVDSEISEVAFSYGKMLGRVELITTIIREGSIYELVFPKSKLDKYLKFKGLIGGVAPSGNLHMCAWTGDTIFDPATGGLFGFCSPLTEIHVFYPLVEIKSDFQIM